MLNTTDKNFIRVGEGVSQKMWTQVSKLRSSHTPFIPTEWTAPTQYETFHKRFSTKADIWPTPFNI